MKPSSACEVLAVLDTQTELIVVHNAIMRHAYPDVDGDPLRPDLASRFYAQTREQFDPQVCLATGMVIHGERWRPGAEFRVLASDESVVLGAARYVAEERNRLKRLANHMSGITGAATAMLNFFGTDRKWRTWDRDRIGV